MADAVKHNPIARYCVVIGVPADGLRDDVRCPACDEMSMLVALDPDFGGDSDVWSS